jgi:peptide/nickel transport system permease protein
MQFLMVFVIVTFLVLIITRLGVEDPARSMLGGTASPQAIAEVNARYHLDSNYVVQYGYWIKNLITLDLGRSEIFSTEVSTLVREKVMVTALIGVYAIALALLIAIPIAVYAAYRRDGLFDKFSSFISFCLVSVPGLVLGVLLALLFAVRLGWFPRVSSKIYPWDDLGGHIENFLLPTLTLALPISAVFVRLLRGDMILTLQSDFVTLARAKGVSPARILWFHALRSSLFSLLTSVGLQLGGLFGGAVVVETLFQLSGLGKMLAEGILRSDLLVVQTGAAILVLSVVLANFFIDLLYAVIDPRIRHARALG